MYKRKTVKVYQGAPVIVTKQTIQSYAEAVENYNPAYLSEEDAKEASFDSIIAPTSFHAQYGYVRMAIGSSNWVPRGSLHTKQHFEFKKIVSRGDYLYSTIEVVHYKDAKNRNYEEYVMTIKNQRDEIVCTGAMTNLLPSKA